MIVEIAIASQRRRLQVTPVFWSSFILRATQKKTKLVYIYSGHDTAFNSMIDFYLFRAWSR